MIPMPPIHCIIERQNSTPRGKASTSMITVAPVVVNPDIDSKKPSVMLVTVPENKNGSIPKIEKKIHTVAVSNHKQRLNHKQPTNHPKYYREVDSMSELAW